METLRERLIADIQDSMKNNKLRLPALRGLITEVIYEEKKGHVGTLLNDEQIITVLLREKKKYEEAAIFSKQAERPELERSAMVNIEILLEYLPEQLTEDKVHDLIQEIIAQNGPFTLPTIGGLMKLLAPQIKGKFDGKRANELAKGEVQEKDISCQ